MRLFNKLQKQPVVTDTEVKEIQARVRAMRDQIGKRDVELADLFALVGEDERPLLRDIGEVKRPEIARVWPHEVPSSPKATPEAAAPTVTYGNWEQMRRKGLMATP
jgi:hypothetical protein